MKMVCVWMRGKYPREYARRAMMYGFLEVLEELELGVCMMRPLKKLRSLMPRSAKLCPHLLHDKVAMELLLRYGEGFWKWFSERTQRFISPYRIAFERYPNVMIVVEEYFTAALTLDKYVMEIVELARASGITALTIYNMWGPIRVSEDTMWGVLDSVSISNLDMLFMSFFKREWGRVLRWVMAHGGIDLIRWSDRVFGMKDRELVKEIVETLPVTTESIAYLACRYSNLDLIPAVSYDRLSIRGCPPVVDHGYIEQCMPLETLVKYGADGLRKYLKAVGTHQHRCNAVMPSTDCKKILKEFGVRCTGKSNPLLTWDFSEFGSGLKGKLLL
jgi:hypothetical protein